jgi:hypothetical protein
MMTRTTYKRWLLKEMGAVLAQGFGMGAMLGSHLFAEQFPLFVWINRIHRAICLHAHLWWLYWN